jgi:hypothetical protein
MYPFPFPEEMLISDTVFYIVYPAQRPLRQQSSVQTVISRLNLIPSLDGHRAIHPGRMGRQHRLNSWMSFISCHVIICLCIALVLRSSKVPRFSEIQQIYTDTKLGIRESIRCPGSWRPGHIWPHHPLGYSGQRSLFPLSHPMSMPIGIWVKRHSPKLIFCLMDIVRRRCIIQIRRQHLFFIFLFCI